MGKYAWRTENREGRESKKPNYSVKWEWKDPDLMGSYTQYTDLVFATNAERAINKVRKMIEDEYGITRRDMVILHAIPIDGMYIDTQRTTHE